MNKTNALRYGLIAIVAALGVWWVWPQAEQGDSVDSHGSSRDGATPGMSNRSAPVRDRDPLHRLATRVRRLPEIAETHPRIDFLLGDDSVSVSQAAVQLRQMALDSTLPLPHRVDALEHGLNLDIEPFKSFAQNPDLPAELTAVFLDEVLNLNDEPELQIRTYLEFSQHADADVSQAAYEMLAFVVGDDFEEAEPATLLQMGREKLANLRQQPQSEPR